MLDALTYAGNPATLDEVGRPVELVEGDIGDLPLVEGLLRDRAVDVVVNFAAESHNSLAVVDPRPVLPHQRARAPRRCSRPAGGWAWAASTTSRRARSTATSTSTAAEDAFTESSPYRPRTPYNASKAGGDHAVRAAYGETYGLPVTITNCCNNYGPYQFPEKVIPLFATLALDDQPLPLYASIDHRREWLHVERPLPGRRRRDRAGPGGRDVPRGQRRRGHHRGGGRRRAGRARQAGRR